MKKFVYLVLFLLPFVDVLSQNEEFALPSIISDHAVMQRNAEVKLWGWCPGTWDLKIVCSWNPTDTIHTSSNEYCNGRHISILHPKPVLFRFVFTVGTIN